MGHFLGLRHTSEPDGLTHDPLTDTPECPADRRTFQTLSGSLLLSVDDCVDLDGLNLMFSTPPTAAIPHTLLSADQHTILRRHPLAY